MDCVWSELPRYMNGCRRDQGEEEPPVHEPQIVKKKKMRYVANTIFGVDVGCPSSVL